MNAINQRLAWKESRLLAPICIACLGLLGILLIAFQTIVNRPSDYVEFAGNLFMSLGCIVGLACGILMFVFEREAGTDTFLECFPVDGRQVARSKLVRTLIFFAIYIVVGLLFTGMALAIYFQGTLSFEGKQRPGFWIGMLVLIPTQCLLWTLVCSMSFRSGLWATITSTFVTLASVVIVNLLAAAWTADLRNSSDTFIVISANLLVCAILGTVIWNLGPTWLRGRQRTVKVRSNLATKASIDSKTCAYPWRALFWQKLKQSWIPWLIGAVGLLTGSYLCGEAINNTFGPFHGGLHPESILPVHWLFIAAGAWIGMLMFSGDQVNSNFLFFQQQTDYPRKVWLSRIGILLLFLPVVWIATILVSPNLRMFQIVAYGQNGYYANDAGWGYHALSSINVVTLTLTFLAAAGLAQLTSMAFRTGSGVVAFVATVVLCIALAAWHHEISSRFGSLVLFTAPIALACFVATWWHAPRWISGRRKKTSAFVAFTACGLVAAATIGGWIWQRVNDFEVPPQSLEWTAFANASDIDSYRQKYPIAADLAVTFKEIKDPETVTHDFPVDLSAEQLEAYFLENEEVFDKISDCLRDEDCGLFLNPRSKTERDRQKNRLRDALKAATLHHLKNKDPKAAFESLMDELRAAWSVAATPHQCRLVLERIWDWSSEDGISPALIRDAIDEVSAGEALIFDFKSELLFRESVFAIERELGALEGQPGYPDLSWEVERSRRWNLDQIDPAKHPSRYWWIDNSRSTRPPDSRTHVVETPMSVKRTATLVQLRSLFRYTRVRLALAGWKLENKQWPESLDELSAGGQPWLNETPLSNNSKQEFVYAATGLDDRVFFTAEHDWSPDRNFPVYSYKLLQAGRPLSGEVIEANQPFLLPWSGAIGRKRAYIEQVYDEESDVTRDSSKTEFIHWIPTPPDSSFRRNVENYILK